MSRHSLQRHRVPLWQVVPLVLLLPTIVAAASLYFDLTLTPFLYTCAFSFVVLLLFISPHSRARWLLAGAVALLGLVIVVSGVNVIDLAAAALAMALSSLRGGA